MAIILASSTNGNVNLTAATTIHLLNDFGTILDDNDDAIDIAATNVDLIVKGTVGADTQDGIDINAGSTGASINLFADAIVFGGDRGIEINDTSAAILNNGSISGTDDGIGGNSVGTFADIVNHGDISGIDDGIELSGADAQILNYGTISALDGDAINLGLNAIVRNFGHISGDDEGIEVDGNATIFNHGSLVSRGGEAIETSGVDNQITNTGEIITDDDDAVDLTGNNSRLVNTGQIISIQDDGVDLNGAGGEVLHVFNSGLISGGPNDVGIRGADSDDTVINHGVINGGVLLGAGADVFRGFGGEVLGEIHGGSANDLLVGSSNDDLLFGDNGLDIIRGGDGDDRLTGGFLRDTLTGGDGADNFDFNIISESAVGGQRDRITDFEIGIDVIDLSTIDAQAGGGIFAGDQAFSFLGVSGFNGVRGELRLVLTGTNTIIEGDTNGDAVADFSILTNFVQGLSATDFVL